MTHRYLYLPLSRAEIEAMERLLDWMRTQCPNENPDKRHLMDTRDRLRTGLLDEVPGGTINSITGDAGDVFQCGSVKGTLTVNHQQRKG